MKSVFSICKIFLFCFFVLYTFSSCTSYLIVNGNQHVPKKVNINISGYFSNGNLTLLDDSNHPADTLIAWPGQKIKWKLTDPGHHAIDTLIAKASNKNPEDKIFNKPPEKAFWSKTWKATIKDSADIQTFGVKDSVGYVNYDYKIVWNIKDSIMHTYDPRIQIR